jgi:superfamily II DNA or RNA helicase
VRSSVEPCLGSLSPTSLIIERRNAFIAVSASDGSPLPKWITDALAIHLVYTRTERLFGAAAIDPMTGLKNPIRYHRELMYEIEPSGRLVCMAGFLPKVRDTLTRMGCLVEFRDLDGPRKRPDAFLPNWDRIAGFEFRDGQEACLFAVASSEGGLIEAAPAFGKSFLIKAISQLFDTARIAVTVRRTDIADGIFADLLTDMPNVGRVGAGNNHVSRVTVYNSDSLHLCNGDVDIVLADEVHELVADKYAESLARVFISSKSRNFGFSATAYDRNDGAHARAEGLFGPTIYVCTQQTSEAAGSVVPIVIEWHDVRMDTNPAEGKQPTARKRWGLWRNKTRNDVIAKIARRYDADTQVLILVASIEHAVYLGKLLPDYTLVYGSLPPADLDFYIKQRLLPPTYRPVDAKRRKQLRVEFMSGELKKAIATGVWSTGVSFDALQVLIRADAQSSRILDVQIPGRVGRVHTASGKLAGLVHDFKDQFDPSYRRAALSRKKSYLSRGWQNVEPVETYSRRVP